MFFEQRRVVCFEDTNVVGNVYYANHVRWQGACRELFLREQVPEILDELERGLSLVTLRVACEYFQELRAFDELSIRMHLAELGHHRMRLLFDYWLVASPSRPEEFAAEELVARGEQELACMRRRHGKLEPEAWPEGLVEALRPYLEEPETLQRRARR